MKDDIVYPHLPQTSTSDIVPHSSEQYKKLEDVFQPGGSEQLLG